MVSNAISPTSSLITAGKVSCSTVIKIQFSVEKNSSRDVRTYSAIHPPLVSAWITLDNVNALIADLGFAGDVDLRFLDMDGVDYWIWGSAQESGTAPD
jgi:hypothetical protein